MDTNASKTPATLPFAAWQALTPTEAAREVHTRLTALPPALCNAAVAWVLPEAELVAQLSPTVGESLLTTQCGPVASERAPTSTSQSPLRGIPYALKDLFDLAGVSTKAGSTFLDKVRPTPTTSSQIVQRLAGLRAVCAAKTHLVEFASGLTGENPHYGDCPHPNFPERLTGGSSSGSAALVAAGVLPLAIGTDTGGSVRVPAAFCGLYGFRLTPGDALIRDAFPLAPTMDTAGWFTRTAPDMLTAWRALVPSSPAATEPHSPKGCYLPMRTLLSDCDPDTARACDTAAAALCPQADESTQQRLLDSWREAVPAYISVGMSEAHQVHRNWLAPYHEHYDPVIWQRFTDAGHFPVERITQARAIFSQVRSTWQDFFRRYDFLIIPATPGPAPRKADCTPELRRAILTLTAPASLGGLPVLSIPIPLPNGLTSGLQVILPRPNSQVAPWLLRAQK